MLMRFAAALLALLALAPTAVFADPVDDAAQSPDSLDSADGSVAMAQHHRHHHKHHHHKKHHHHHHKHADDEKEPVVKADAAARSQQAPAKHTAAGSAVLKRVTHAKPVPAAKKTAASAKKTAPAVTEKNLVSKVHSLEKELKAKEQKNQADMMVRKSLKVNGPLPPNFEQEFSAAVGKATHSDPSKVKVVSELPAEAGIVQVFFEAPKKVADDAEDEAGDPDSPLATGQLQSFLTAKSEPAEADAPVSVSQETGKSLDINAAMPYGDLEPFGREDTGQELTEDSISESNEMVDQLERAEVAEEKRAVFRALTRLRGAAITSFDGIARSQTGNIDEYNKVNKWRKTHPLHHLADEESDVSRWAFPDIADF